MNDNTKNKTIELGSVTIYEFGAPDPPIASVNLNIPYNFRLNGLRNLSEYKRIAFEDVRTKQNSLFKLINFLATSVREEDWNDETVLMIAESVILLAEIGSGLCETNENIEMSFIRYENKREAQQ